MKNNTTAQVICLVAAGTLLSALQPAAAQKPEQPSQIWEPIVYAGDTVTLLDAVRLTLENNPNIRLQEESAGFQEGLLQEASGQFDAALLGELSYESIQQELTAGQKKIERDLREKIQQDLDNGLVQLAFAEQVLGEISMLADDPTGAQVSDPDLQANIDQVNISIRNADTPEEREELERLRDQVIQNSEQAYSELVDELRVEVERDATELENLGTPPEEEETYFGRLNLQILKPYRSGVAFGPFVEYTVSGDRFVGKPVDQDFGGKGIEDIYRGTVGFTVDVPLARDRGRAATGASERAGQIDYEASLSSIRHSANTSILLTLLSYWDAVATQESVAILTESAALQAKLVEYTQILIDADEIPAAELARVRAREAEILASVDEARRFAHEARIALSQAIGLRVEDTSHAPLPTDSFPPPPPNDALESVEIAALVREAPARRSDYDAAVQLQTSGGVLLRAAEINLRPRVDLGTRFWYNSLSESSGSLGSWVGPSYNLALDVDWPFANNTQRGKLLQAEAATNARAIEAADLERLIRSNVVQVFGSLRETLEQLDLAVEAVNYYRQSVEAEIERFRFAGATLIDTLLTEQRLREAELSQVSAGRRYAQLLAQLRFETGSLISETTEGVLVVDPQLLTVPGGEGASDG